MLKEVIIVEGKMDVVAINKALKADTIITGGFTLSKKTLTDIKTAYKKRGIIILTDPDAAGERIRRFLTKRFPLAKHAFVPREEATYEDDIGIEDASPASILAALKKVRTASFTPLNTFCQLDLLRASLVGESDARKRRAKLGKILGIGYANAKTFLKRLNHYGVTREEFTKALEQLVSGEKNAII